MLHQNPRRLCTGNNGGTHVILSVLAYDIRAHHAGNLRRVQNGNCHNKRQDRRPHNNNHGCSQRDTGEGHDNVHNAHDDLGNPGARNSSNSTNNGSQHQRKRRRTQADGQRVASTKHNARQNIAALVVGAEQKVRARRQTSRVNLQGVIRGNQISRYGHQNDKQQHRKRNLAHGAHCAEMGKANFLARICFQLRRCFFTKLNHATPS